MEGRLFWIKKIWDLIQEYWDWIEGHWDWIQGRLFWVRKRFGWMKRPLAWAIFIILAIGLACGYYEVWSFDNRSDPEITPLVKDGITYLLACLAFGIALDRSGVAHAHSEHSLRGHYLSLYQIGSKMIQKDSSRLSGLQLLINLAKSAQIKSEFIHHVNVMRLFSEFVCDISHEKTPAGIKAKIVALEFLTSRKWRTKHIIQEIEECEEYQVILDGADLTQVDLDSTLLKNFSLRRAILESVPLNHANLERAYLNNAKLTDAKLVGAKLIKADLAGAKLMGAKLMGANLTEADLTEANLTEANLTGAKLTGANLTGANLTKADGIGSIKDFKGIWAYQGDEPIGLPNSLMNEVRKNLEPLPEPESFPK